MMKRVFRDQRELREKKPSGRADWEHVYLVIEGRHRAIINTKAPFKRVALLL